MFLALAVGSQPGATAQPPAIVSTEELRDSVTLREVLDLLENRGTHYKAVQYEVEVAKSGARAARVLPNPVLSLAILYLNQGFNQNGVATYYANVTLPLLIAGQRRWRVKTANANVDAAEARVHVQYQELAHAAFAKFVEIQAAQERINVFNAALAEVAALEASLKVPTSEVVLDGLRSAIEISRLRVRLAEMDAKAQNSAGELGVLLGIPSWHPRAEGPLEQIGITGDAARLWAEVEATQPAVQAARREEFYAHKGVQLARRERWPMPAITVGTVAIQNYYSISTFVGLTTPVPVFDWGQGLLARANARDEHAKLEKDAVIAEAQGELHRLFRRLEHRRAALQVFEHDVLSKVPTMKRLAQDALDDGQPALGLEITLAGVEVKVAHIDKYEAVVQAELDVLAAAGRIDEAASRYASQGHDGMHQGQSMQ